MINGNVQSITYVVVRIVGKTMLFGRKKKEELHKGDVFLAKGIYLRQPVMSNGNTILNCFLRSIIVFLLTFGSLGGFLSAFSVSYNYILVVVLYLGLALFFSWLYALPNFLYRDLGYILFFSLFVFSIFRLRFYANSGFYVVVNRVLEVAQGFFELSGVRQYETTIDKPYLTVAIMACFVGLVYIIILNIWLSSNSSVFWTVIVTFPVLLIPLYMRMIPDPLYMIVLGVGYLSVVMFKANGHYTASPKGVSFYIKGLKKNRIIYTQDSKTFRQTVMRVLLLTFCGVIISMSFFPKTAFEGSFKTDPLREQTSEAIGNFVLLGFSGLYNRYASTGGISGGKLGGISNVTPDYQPDLIVTFAPYSNEAVYLKAYTGGRYGDNQWIDIYEQGYVKKLDDIDIFEDESMKEEALALRDGMHAGEEYSGMGKMDITNVGANVSYMYYPYYTVFQDYSDFNHYSMMRTTNGIYLDETATYYYYPKVVWEDELGEIIPSQQDISDINEIYMEVPEKNVQVLQNEIQAIGLTQDMTVNEITEAVDMYFEENIPYTLRPGATPRGEDFVNYFLTENRKGYCAHFATTATLIFRQMGIPARYVEGYAFGLEAALASDENLDKKYFDYYEGFSLIGESTVLDVEVTDAMAHAWVEIYIDGFGWKVIEVTPGSNEASDEENFWDAFSAILNDSTIGSDWGTDTMFGELNFAQYAWLIYVVIGVLILVVIIRITIILCRKIMRYCRCHMGERSVAVVAYYADLCDMIRTCNQDFNACRSHAEQLEYMNVHFDTALDVATCSYQIEKFSFSSTGLEADELMRLMAVLKQIRKAIWKHVNWKQKIRLCKR